MEVRMKVEGTAALIRSLRQFDGELPRVMRDAINDAADRIVMLIQPKVPHLTGRAAASVHSKPTRAGASIHWGGNAAPYMPWLDFGGTSHPPRPDRGHTNSPSPVHGRGTS